MPRTGSGGHPGGGVASPKLGLNFLQVREKQLWQPAEGRGAQIPPPPEETLPPACAGLPWKAHTQAGPASSPSAREGVLSQLPNPSHLGKVPGHTPPATGQTHSLSLIGDGDTCARPLCPEMATHATATGTCLGPPGACCGPITTLSAVFRAGVHTAAGRGSGSRRNDPGH